MGPGYLIRREPDQSDGYHNEKRADHDIKYNEPKEKQAAAKQTFVFPARLANEYPAEAGWRVRMQDEECDSTDSRATNL